MNFYTKLRPCSFVLAATSPTVRSLLSSATGISWFFASKQHEMCRAPVLEEPPWPRAQPLHHPQRQMAKRGQSTMMTTPPRPMTTRTTTWPTSLPRKRRPKPNDGPISPVRLWCYNSLSPLSPYLVPYLKRNMHACTTKKKNFISSHFISYTSM